MGTINYRTSDYITLGYDCSGIDYEEDCYNDFILDLFDQINFKLQKEDFHFFHVRLKPGYYEGFSLYIEHNCSLFYDDFEEKRLAQKEITRLKNFLLYCVENCECVAVFPGWCTGYANYTETLKLLDAAVFEMRETVRSTPTYNKYVRKEGIA